MSEDARGRGMRFMALFEEIKKVIDKEKQTIEERELRDLLKALEGENVVGLYGNRRAPLIRLVSQS